MAFTGVVLLLSISLVVADDFKLKQIGNVWGDSIEILGWDSRLFHSSYVSFNLDKKFDLTVDAVRVKFHDEGYGTVSLVAGGNSEDSFVKFKIMILNYGKNSNKEGTKRYVWTTIEVFGRWAPRKRQYISASELQFEPVN